METRRIGALEVSAVGLGPFAGVMALALNTGGVLGKLSRRFGEGVLNGALTARLGLAAMEELRPMPFAALARPGVSATVSRALAGMFGRVQGQSDDPV